VPWIAGFRLSERAHSGREDERLGGVWPCPTRRPHGCPARDGAAGVYVAGGLTPGYRQALVAGGTGWLAGARDAGLVFAGFSAGAAIASAHALVGGAHVNYRGRTIDVCHGDCAEELDTLTVLPGLGLVPFTVEVHAAQWGTLYRLVHALTAASVAAPGPAGVGPRLGFHCSAHRHAQQLVERVQRFSS
jgi:cyanophycinase-like exopeptidase